MKTVIVIEAGHGIGDPGKRSPNPAKYGGPERMFEPEWNREIEYSWTADWCARYRSAP